MGVFMTNRELVPAPNGGDKRRVKAALRKTIRAARHVVAAYDAEHPWRTADFHPASCPCLRCAIDALRDL
jgi:hypothetical protein